MDALDSSFKRLDADISLEAQVPLYNDLMKSTAIQVTTLKLSLLLQPLQGHIGLMHTRHPLSRWRLLDPRPVWLMFARTGSMWRMPVIAEQY